MKRNGLIVTITAIAALALCVATIVVNASTMAYLNKPNELADSHEYPLTARVVGVFYNTDTVLVETATGITYSFYGTEDYECNDMVSMIMHDNGTDSVYDDEILSVRFSGYVYTNIK